MRYPWIGRLALALFLVPSVCAAPETAAQNSFDVDVPGGKSWTDTGIDLPAGARVRISATGNLTLPGSKENGPDGLARSWRDLLRMLPVNDVGRGAFIARIGDTGEGRPFLIGPQLELRVQQAGRLYLGINFASNDKAEGAYKAKVEIVERPVEGAKPAATIDVEKAPTTEQVGPVGLEILEKFPRRVQDAEGTQGDLTNFLVVGSEQRLRRALEAAGWVTVDRTPTDAVIHGLLATFSKQAYVTLPMSELEVFGRPQDYGYAHAEPFRVVAQRHHFRIWKAPFDADGQTVWVGAGTHDIGFDRDQRDGKLTHKIDPQVDGERTFIGQSLADTGVVAQVGYIMPKDSIQKAKTAHGEEFFSDGRLLVVILSQSNTDRSTSFADTFCAVLDREKAEGADWGDCTTYLDLSSRPTQTEPVKLCPIPDKYRLLVVPGVFGLCTGSSAPAFQGAREALTKTYGLTTELLAMPNDSTEANAERIAKYIKEHSVEDQRPYIVIGYSKGGPDVQYALESDQELDKHVAAFVTVAGAVGGSPIADILPGNVHGYMQELNLGSCTGDLSATFKSLERRVRQAFLDLHPEPSVRTYSLSAVADYGRVSKIMQQNWRLMSVYGPKQDSQLMKEDTIVPGAVYLGSALADHFAVALPFDSMSEAKVREFLDQNRYPRTALLESIVRFVAADLESQRK